MSRELNLINASAKHFNVTNEAMRQLKRKWEREERGLWLVYVKAYNWDIKDIL